VLPDFNKRLQCLPVSRREVYVIP